MVIIEDWVETFRKGVIYYLRNNHVRGVLLWNTSSLLDAARELILSAQEYAVNSRVGRLHDSIERTG